MLLLLSPTLVGVHWGAGDGGWAPYSWLGPVMWGLPPSKTYTWSRRYSVLNEVKWRVTVSVELGQVISQLHSAWLW